MTSFCRFIWRNHLLYLQSLIALHASPHKNSNVTANWQLIKTALAPFQKSYFAIIALVGQYCFSPLAISDVQFRFERNLTEGFRFYLEIIKAGKTLMHCKISKQRGKNHSMEFVMKAHDTKREMWPSLNTLSHANKRFSCVSENSHGYTGTPFYKLTRPTRSK